MLTDTTEVCGENSHFHKSANLTITYNFQDVYGFDEKRKIYRKLPV